MLICLALRPFQSSKLFVFCLLNVFNEEFAGTKNLRSITSSLLIINECNCRQKMKREVQMGTYITVAKDVYLAALEEDWDRMKLACSGSSDMYVMSPVTVSEDTPLHLAVYSKRVKPLQTLLDIAKKNPMVGNPCTKKNAYGNTVLHEAVSAGNMEAVKHLLQGEYDPSMQLQTKNALGETPFYRAAACGQKEIVEYLAEERGLFSERKLSEDHRKREDSKPILHAAIQGQHFGFVLNPFILSQTRLLRHLAHTFIPKHFRYNLNLQFIRKKKKIK